MKPFTSKHCKQYLTKETPLYNEDPKPKKDPDKFTSMTLKKLVAIRKMPLKNTVV